MNQLLTISQVAKLLKINGSDPIRKCRNFLRSIEQKRDIKVIIEQNGRFYTTEPILQSVLPELFEENTFAKDSIKGLKEQVELLTKKFNSLSVKFQELEAILSKKR